jgi:diguanylate cyclase (GGDEF)-like protein
MMPGAVDRFLRARSTSESAVISLMLVALVGVLDYATGREWSFSVFYLVPVAFATWYSSTSVGYLVCGLSAAVWLIVDYTANNIYSNELIPFWNATVRLGFFVVTAYLVSNLQARLIYEQTMARTDGLTGLLNAQAFKETSARLLELAERHHHETALGYIDLDNFKAVNDSLGHAEGDRVLQAVAYALNAGTRSTDVVARLGGDEFVVLLPETGREDAETMFGRIRQDLTEYALNEGWPVGFSIGVAVYRDVPTTVDEALEAADHLMYHVKATGKNNMVFEDQPQTRRETLH